MTADSARESPPPLPRYAELNPHVIMVPTPVVPMRDLDHHSAAHDSGVVGVELRGPFPDVRFNRFGVGDISKRHSRWKFHSHHLCR